MQKHLHLCFRIVFFDTPRTFLHMHISQYASVVDMLRNEEPVWIVYTDPTDASIYTGTVEPVGEEETP